MVIKVKRMEENIYEPSVWEDLVSITAIKNFLP